MLMADFWSMPTACSKGSRLMFCTKSEVERDEWHDPAGRPGLRHGVVHLPVLVADRGRRRAREVEEVVTRRLVRRPSRYSRWFTPSSVVLTMPGYCPALDLLLQILTLRTARDVTKVGNQSSAANNWFFIVPGLMCPGQRTTQGAR